MKRMKKLAAVLSNPIEIVFDGKLYVCVWIDGTIQTQCYTGCCRWTTAAWASRRALRKLIIDRQHSLKETGNAIKHQKQEWAVNAGGEPKVDFNLCEKSWKNTHTITCGGVYLLVCVCASVAKCA